MKTVRIRLDHIDASKMSPPHKEKFSKYLSYYNSVKKNNNKLNKANPIVIDSHNVLVDGFCSYFIISKSGQKTIQCLQAAHGEKLVKVINARYIKKSLSLSRKSYTWKVKNNPVIPDEVVFSNTPHGKVPILIQNIAMLPQRKASTFSFLKLKR